MALYAIGDIQGCMSSLERLLSTISFSPQTDRLWLVGDLVNRGPRSLDVLRWAMELGPAVTCVLGNHDIHLLARAAGAVPEKKRDTLDDVLAARDLDRVLDWVRSRPLVHVEDNYVMVHGGLHPRWTAEDARARGAEIERELRAPTWRTFVGQLQGTAPRWDDSLAGADRWRAILAYLTRARMLKPDGRIESGFDGPPSQAPAGLIPWFQFPNAAWTSHTVVFGHWAALGLSVGPRHLGLDTGCVWGNSLTAMRLPDRTVFQVKAVEKAS
ncbi:MAG: symmetrical bis(5'-nucleosyl)-tetraphosphatase [Kofleriaceae bacterium]|nr:symmetrical bis(5'-nucleosyl)-tetraphosphatase [Kofleriaceae bacterium]